MMAVNSSSTTNGFRTTNGTMGNDCQVSSTSPEEKPEFSLKVKAKFVYIGKIKSPVSSVDIRNDRIVLSNISNGQNKAKYNITVPFVEIIALRYCFNSDISIFVIQPIYESYQKLSEWINANPVTRLIPENFIMVQFETSINSQTFETIKFQAKGFNKNLKIIEIKAVFANTYLNTPNKSNNGKTAASKASDSSQEVIHLEDDDDDHPNDTKVNMLAHMILKYPDNETNSIMLYGRDLNCIRDGQYLNDNILNFYLKYFQYNGNLDRNILDKIYIYDALFSSKLLSNPRKRKVQMGHLKGFLVYTQDTFGDVYQKNLKQWTKDIDIFSKDFILIPIVKDSHWFLVILCHIGNLIPPQSNGHSSETNPPEIPTIIMMDSLNNYVPKNDVYKAICRYLQFEYKEKRHSTQTLNMNLLRELFPKVPMQQNYYDCGLFVLEYIERFLSNPEKVLKTIEKNSCSLDNWFEASSLNTKRAKIKQIILNFLPPEDAVTLERELDKRSQEDVDRPATPPAFANNFPFSSSF